MVHTPVICRNLENRHLRRGTKRIHVRLIVTIPTIVRSSKGTDERPRMYSLGMVSYRLPSRMPAFLPCSWSPTASTVTPSGRASPFVPCRSSSSPSRSRPLPRIVAQESSSCIPPHSPTSSMSPVTAPIRPPKPTFFAGGRILVDARADAFCLVEPGRASVCHSAVGLCSWPRRTRS